MKRNLIITLVLPLFLACNPAKKNKAEEPQKIVVQDKDKQILNEVLELFEDEKDAPTAALMIKVGTFFKGTPYVAHTLETEPEQLIVDLRGLDCTTFAENCLAISRTIKSKKPDFDEFAKELENIRYRNGKIDGYPSRLHYFSDWIYENEQKGLVKNVTKEIAEIPFDLHVNFMSNHPDSYKQLKDSTLIPVIKNTEREINSRKMYYIPEDKISEYEDQLQDGDIAGITTNIGGMDIQHVVLLVRKDGHIHILHASSAGEKVMLSENTLEDYLLNSKTATGIMIARPL